MNLVKSVGYPARQPLQPDLARRGWQATSSARPKWFGYGRDGAIHCLGGLGACSANSGENLF
jgi:hypothetical protein